MIPAANWHRAAFSAGRALHYVADLALIEAFGA
jgi:hypothetical protein